MKEETARLTEETRLIARTSGGYYLASYGSVIFANIERYLFAKLNEFGYERIRLVSLRSVVGRFKDKIYYDTKGKLDGETYLCLATQYRTDNAQEANHEALRLADLFRAACQEIVGLPTLFTRTKRDKEYFVGALTPEGVLQIAAASVRERKGVFLVRASFYSRIIEATARELSDEEGLIISPSVAPYEIGVIRVYRADASVASYASDIVEQLTARGARVFYEKDRESHLATLQSYKKMGIPLILEIGRKDVGEEKINVFSRPDGSYERLSLTDFYDRLEAYLRRVHNEIVKQSTLKLTHYLRNAQEKDDALIEKFVRCARCAPKIAYDEEKQILLTPFNQGEDRCGLCGQSDARTYYLIKKAPNIE